MMERERIEYVDLFSSLRAMEDEQQQERGRQLLVMAVEAGLEDLVQVLLEWGGTEEAKATNADGVGLLELCGKDKIRHLLRSAGVAERPEEKGGGLCWRSLEPPFCWRGGSPPTAGQEVEPGICEAVGRPGEYVVQLGKLFQRSFQEEPSPLCRQVVGRLFRTACGAQPGRGVWVEENSGFAYCPGQTYGEMALEYVVSGHGGDSSLGQWGAYLSFGANINGFASQEESLLMAAIRRCQFALAEWLIRHGADNEASYPLSPKRTGFLHLLAETLPTVQGHPELYEAGLQLAELWLARPCIHVDFRTEAGLTALHCACMAADARMASLLLSHGADVNARTMTGKTPLLCAATRGDEVQKVLLEAGANPWAESVDGRSPVVEELMFSREGKGSVERARRMLAYAGPMPTGQRQMLLALFPSLDEEGRSLACELLA